MSIEPPAKPVRPQVQKVNQSSKKKSKNARSMMSSATSATGGVHVWVRGSSSGALPMLEPLRLGDCVSLINQATKRPSLISKG